MLRKLLEYMTLTSPKSVHIVEQDKKLKSKDSINVLRFNDIKERLKEILGEKLKEHFNDKYFLVEGFFNISIYDEIDKDIILLAGNSVPMIIIANKENEMLQFFALKKLMPDLDFWKEH